MTWIKTFRMDEDERVKSAIEAERKLYPVEYRTPAPAVDRGEEKSITASHSLIPDALYHSFPRSARCSPRTCHSFAASMK